MNQLLSKVRGWFRREPEIVDEPKTALGIVLKGLEHMPRNEALHYFKCRRELYNEAYEELLIMELTGLKDE